MEMSAGWVFMSVAGNKYMPIFPSLSNPQKLWEMYFILFYLKEEISSQAGKQERVLTVSRPSTSKGKSRQDWTVKEKPTLKHAGEACWEGAGHLTVHQTMWTGCPGGAWSHSQGVGWGGRMKSLSPPAISPLLAYAKQRTADAFSHSPRPWMWGFS